MRLIYSSNQMEYRLRFIRINPDFDQAHADEVNNGRESEENIKFLWEDEIAITEPVEFFKIKNKTSFVLRGSKGETTFEHTIPNMCVIAALTEAGNSIELGISQNILKETKKRFIENGTVEEYRFFLKGKEEPKSPYHGLYIDAKDFPQELI